MATTPRELDDFDQGSRWTVKTLDSSRILHCLWRNFARKWRHSRWLDTVLSGFPGDPERRCDLIAEFLSIDGTGPPVAGVVENMTGPIHDMQIRFGEYCLRLRRELFYQRGKPTVPYQVVCGVLLLTGKAPADEWVTLLDDFECEIKVRFKILALRDLDAEVILREIVSNETSWDCCPMCP